VKSLGLQIALMFAVRNTSPLVEVVIQMKLQKMDRINHGFTFVCSDALALLCFTRSNEITKSNRISLSPASRYICDPERQCRSYHCAGEKYGAQFPFHVIAFESPITDFANFPKAVLLG
jgi:hypothetical protein